MAMSAAAKAGAAAGVLLLIGALGVSIATLIKVYNKDSDVYVTVDPVVISVTPKNIGNVYKRPVSNTKAYQDAAAYFAASVDTSVNPCDDFYQYACGKYNNTISFDVVDTNNYKTMAQGYATINNNDPLPVKQVKQMYAQCVSDNKNWGGLVKDGYIVRNAVKAFMDKSGFKFPLFDKSTDDWPTADALGTALGSLSGFNGIDTLITPYIDTNWKDPSGQKSYLLFIDQPTLTLTHSYYVGSAWAETKVSLKNMITAYFTQYNAVINGKADSNSINKAVDDILNFEYMIANNYSTDDKTRWVSSRSYNLYTTDTFNAGFVNIQNYLKELTVFSSNQTQTLVNKKGFQFSLAEPGQLTKMSLAFNTGFGNTTTASTLYNYIMYRVINNYANYFPVTTKKSEFITQFTMHKPTIGRPSPIRSRQNSIIVDDVDTQISLNCVQDTVFSALQYANARVFIDKIYPTNDSRVAIRKSIQKVVDGILIGMQSMIDQLDWMTPNSKKGAYSKIQHLVRNYAYPDFITNDKHLTQYYNGLPDFTNKNYYQIQNYNLQFMLKQQFDMLLRTHGVDRTDFNGPPGTVNAWYQPELNSITFPAAILQRPYFDPDWPASINYGALGVVAGHELTHSFDSSGTQWNGFGQLLGWLDDTSQVSFNAMADCVIQEYSGFCPLKNTNYTPSCINGQQTVGENVADNGGIHSAFRAYRNAINYAGSDPLLPGDLVSTFTHDQIFFLSFAQVWCQLPSSDSALYRQLMVDPHSPSKYRVFGTLQNYPGFQNAFNCPTGATYSPKKHCSVWISDVNITTPANMSTANELNVPAAPAIAADQVLYLKYQQAQQYFKGTVNITADPCNDFYNYACGATTLPLSFTTYRNKNYETMRQEYEKISSPGYNGDLGKLQSIQKTMQYYKACNETYLNLNAHIKDGSVVQTILDEFKTYTGLEFNWFADTTQSASPAILAKAMAFLTIKYNVDTLVTPFIDVRPNTTLSSVFKGFALYFDQNSLFYLKSYYQGGAWDITRPTYLNNAKKLLKDFAKSRDIENVNDDRLEATIKKMLDLEFTLANSPYSANDTIRRQYGRWVNPTKVSDIKYNFLDWKQFTQSLNDLSGVNFIPKNTKVDDYHVSIAEPDALKKLDDNFKTFDQDLIVKYLYYRLLAQHAAFVPSQNASTRYERLYPEQGLSHALGQRLPTPDPFEEKADVDPHQVMINCVVETLNLMQYSNARVFTEILYPNDDARKIIRSETNKTISAIRDAMQSMLDQLTWLDASSQEGARNKIKNLQLNLAYPDFILNDTLLENYYSTLTFAQNDDYFAMMKKLNVFNRYQMYVNLTQDNPNRQDFLGPPGTVNAWYQPELNSITIPEGILQQPYFDSNWPASIKFGALGVIVGHELGHGFDDQGVQWDGEGQLKTWMSDASYSQFLNMAQCVIDEYNGFTPLNSSYSPNHLNGYNTQGENVADNGGIHSGWRAYRNWIALNGPDPQLPDLMFGQYTHDQLFFLSFAQVWCQTPPTADAIYKQILVDPHSPSYYRVWGTIQNFPAFRTAFNCPVNSKYAPSKHCHVWVPET